MDNIIMIDLLKERLVKLETEMDKVSKELVEKLSDKKKVRAVKRLSLKLHEVSSEIIDVKEEITALEKQAKTRVIEEGAYTISILNGEQAKIEKNDGTLVLNYIYLENILVGGQVYSSFKRSNGKVNETEIYELELHWAQRKGSISKKSKAEIALAEEALVKHMGFVGSKQIV